MDWTCTHNIAAACRAAVVNAPDDLYTTWRLQGGSSRGGTDGRRDQGADNRARKMKLSLCTVETSIRILQVQGQEKASFQVAMEVERWPRVQTHAIGTPKAEAVGSDPRWRGKCSASCMTADGGRRTAAARSRRLDRSRESRMLSSTLVITRTITAQPWRRCVSVSAATKARASRA